MIKGVNIELFFFEVYCKTGESIVKDFKRISTHDHTNKVSDVFKIEYCFMTNARVGRHNHHEKVC